MPIAVIARVLGLPDADTETLDRAKGWMEAVLAWRHSYGEDPESRAAAVEATRMLEPLLLDTVRARRDDPRDDAISFLWAKGREVADDWGEQDVLDNAKFLFEGGSETTAFLICNAVHRLLGFPADVRARRWRIRMPSRASSRRSCGIRRSSTCGLAARLRTWISGA